MLQISTGKFVFLETLSIVQIIHNKMAHLRNVSFMLHFLKVFFFSFVSLCFKNQGISIFSVTILKYFCVSQGLSLLLSVIYILHILLQKQNKNLKMTVVLVVLGETYNSKGIISVAVSGMIVMWLQY